MTAAAGGVVEDLRGRVDLALRRRVLAALCVTQVIGWGVLYYGFPVLQSGIVADTGWSRSAVAGAFTLGQVVAAVAGVAVGPVLDRRGPWVVMTAGSAAAVVSLLLVASAPGLGSFALGWMLTGLAMAGALYAPAFAAITGWFHGRERIRALTVLTVAGGLASTVFAPLTASLHAHLSWRSTYAVLAGLLAVTVLVHAVGLRGPWPARQPHRAASDRTVRAVLRSRAFLALGLALTVTGLCSTAVVVGLVPMLREQGVPLGTASVLLGLGGLGQVAGRLCFGPISARVGPVGQTVGVLAALSVTTALLASARAVPVLVAVVLVAGAARGALTLLRAMAVTDRWGVAHYGRLSGLLAMPVALASAAAPWVSASLAAVLAGYDRAFLVLAALNLVAVALAALSTGGRAGSSSDSSLQLLRRPTEEAPARR